MLSHVNSSALVIEAQEDFSIEIKTMKFYIVFT